MKKYAEVINTVEGQEVQFTKINIALLNRMIRDLKQHQKNVPSDHTTKIEITMKGAIEIFKLAKKGLMK